MVVDFYWDCILLVFAFFAGWISWCSGQVVAWLLSLGMGKLLHALCWFSDAAGKKMLSFDCWSLYCWTYLAQVEIIIDEPKEVDRAVARGAALTWLVIEGAAGCCPSQWSFGSDRFRGGVPLI